MIVAHATHVTPLPARLWIAIAAIAGLLGALAMNVPMRGLAEGYTPAIVAASLLSGSLPSTVSRRTAVVTHHAVGPVAGLLYVGCAIALDAILPPVSRTAGLSLSAHLVSVGLVSAFVYALFSSVVLPRYGGAARDRMPTVRRHWLASTATFGVTLAVAVPLLATTVW
ncbi:hypothetical protein [Halorientalis salina]|uniref:hypothetical protein n=1 Tax=Halorientalis salina TaxID=2932266 RepID=UPI0010ABAA63|nr:hypothetical protein [Halorientalis salina]